METKLYFATPNDEYATKCYEWLKSHRLYSGVHRVLASFFYHSKACVPRVLSPVCNGDYDLVLDSGAFTVKNTGGTIQRRDYAEWIRRQVDAAGGRLYFYLNLDVIGDASETARNQMLFERVGLHPLPVYHIVSPIAEFKALSERYEHLAVGGIRHLTGADLYRKLDEVFGILTPRHRLHGLAVTRIQTMWRYPFDSVDSSSWLGPTRFGRIPIYNEQRMRFDILELKDRNSWLRSVASMSRLRVATKELLDLWSKRDARWRYVAAGLGMYAYIQMNTHLNSLRNK